VGVIEGRIGRLGWVGEAHRAERGRGVRRQGQGGGGRRSGDIVCDFRLRSIFKKTAVGSHREIRGDVFRCDKDTTGAAETIFSAMFGGRGGPGDPISGEAGRAESLTVWLLER